MALYKLSCTDCGKEIAHRHNGPRKENTWLLMFAVCPACKTGNFGRDYDGKKPREMQQQSLDIQMAILETFHKEGMPLTIRRLFYVLANRYQLVPKTKNGYRTVQYQTVNMRRAGSVPYNWIADNSRWVVRPETFTGLEGALQSMHDYYRRDLWSRQNAYVEIWIEKDSMAGVVSPITQKYGVPLYVARGFSSLTLIHQAAEEIKSIGKPTFIYQVGDFDKAGFELAKAVPRELEEEHGVNVEFERLAITEEQIEKFDLPTRPASFGKVKRSKKWPYDFAVDLDAMEAPVLRRLVEDAITQHIDADEWEAARKTEQLEKGTLQDFINHMPQNWY